MGGNEIDYLHGSLLNQRGAGLKGRYDVDLKATRGPFPTSIWKDEGPGDLRRGRKHTLATACPITGSNVGPVSDRKKY